MFAKETTCFFKWKVETNYKQVKKNMIQKQSDLKLFNEPTRLGL